MTSTDERRCVPHGSGKRPSKSYTHKDNQEPNDERLDSALVSYFRRVQDNLDDSESEIISDPSSLEIFIDNVFSEVIGNEDKLSRHPVVSSILEKLLLRFNGEKIVLFSEAILKSGPDFLCDKYASHVAQATLARLCFLSRSNDATITMPLLRRLCKMVSENVERFIMDTYSSHIVRALLQQLSGVHLPQEIIRSGYSCSVRKTFVEKEDTKPSKDIRIEKVPQRFIKMHRRIVDSIMENCPIGNVLSNQVGNPVLQTVLYTLEKMDMEFCQHVCEVIATKSRLLDEDKSTSLASDFQIPLLMMDSVASFLMQALISVASSELLFRIYTTHLKGHLMVYVLHPKANFVLKVFLEKVNDAPVAGMVIDELLCGLEAILAAERVKIILALIDLSQRTNLRRKELVKSIKSAFQISHGHKDTTGAAAKVLLSFNTWAVFFGIKSTDQPSSEDTPLFKERTLTAQDLSHYGAYIVSSLFAMEESRWLISSFMCLTEMELLVISSHQNGSRVVEAFFRSRAVTKKQKTGLVRKIKNSLVDMACAKFGSFVVRTIWASVDLTVKQLIADSLLPQLERLHGCPSGQAVSIICRLDHYLTRSESWVLQQTRLDKKRKLFKDIITTGADAGMTTAYAKTPLDQEHSYSVLELGSLGNHPSKMALPKTVNDSGYQSSVQPRSLQSVAGKVDELDSSAIPSKRMQPCDEHVDDIMKALSASKKVKKEKRVSLEKRVKK